MDLEITPEIIIPDRDLRFVAALASGPGGQNVNKVATKVDLRFDLDGTTALDESVKERLRRQERLDSEGRIVVTSDATRSQRRNLDDAREKLRALILRALTPPKKRRPTRPSRASKRRRLDAKRRQGEKKRFRGSIHQDDS